MRRQQGRRRDFGSRIMRTKHAVVLLIGIGLLALLTGCGDGGGGGSAAAAPQAAPQEAALPWTGIKQMGTAGADYGTDIVLDASGNIYVTGSTEGDLDGNVNAGSFDLFVVKYDISGVKQWTRQLGTAGIDSGNGIAADASGNVYVAGTTDGSLDGNVSAGSNDLVVVKYDASGVKQWTRQLGSVVDDIAYGVAVDASGNIYVTGSTEGDLDGNVSAGIRDLFVVKYNSAGVKQWTQQFGSVAIDQAVGIGVGASGNVYVAGYTAGGLDGNINAGAIDLFVVKYNSAGVRQWTRQLGTLNDDIAQGIAVDGSGNVYVSGYTSGGLDGNVSAGSIDLFVVKYDASGVKQWTRQLGSAGDDFGRGVVLDASGNIYVTGYTDSGLDGNVSSGGTDIFIVKYDVSGSKQWTRQFGSAATDEGYGIAADASGAAYVTGMTLGGLDGNVNAGSADFFAAKYSSSGVKQ